MKPSISSHPVAEVEILPITSELIQLSELLALSHHPQAGAVVLFSGEVRNISQDREVLYLEYEAFNEMAEKLIREILEDARKKWNLTIAICQHRIGKVDISEGAVAVITASKHRKEAYEANQYIIDRVKHEAPIWKKEFFADGTSEWSHNCGCHLPHE